MPIPTMGNDNLTGTNGDDIIDALEGNDLVRGGKGDDIILGGAGNDRLFGEAGNDIVVDDGGGNDFLDGGAGNDIVVDSNLEGSGIGDDTLLGGVGNDIVVARDGTTASLDGGSGNDIVASSGHSGRSTLTGGSGNDVLSSMNEVSSLDGGSGNDTLLGSGGYDAGKEEQDSMASLYFADTLRGGSGDDTLIFGTTDGINAAAVVDGGTGNNDTLQVGVVSADGPLIGGAIDFTLIADSHVTGIERIDLIHNMDSSSVVLNANDVLALSNSSNSLYITGDSLDTVDLGAGMGLGGFSMAGTQTTGGITYDRYINGAATVLIEQDVQVV